jgi:hypothetical protein
LSFLVPSKVRRPRVVGGSAGWDCSVERSFDNDDVDVDDDDGLDGICTRMHGLDELRRHDKKFCTTSELHPLSIEYQEGMIRY